MSEAAFAALVEAQFPTLSRICLNGARWHPLPRVAADAMIRHARFRAADGGWGLDFGSQAQDGARAMFARLIGAAAADIALVPSTTVAEQWVVAALDLPRAGAIVTDLMHFDASIRFYDALAEAGGDVHVVEPVDGCIRLEDVDDALSRGNVKLVSVSAISNMTGFAHDLTALCRLAHGHGALVYADVIQAAGAVPIDVAATGIDFCAASGYKWLMGDMGLGFLYVSPRVMDRLERPIFGFRQIACDIEPWPPRGPRDWVMRADARGLFETASLAVTAAVSLEASMGLIAEMGVEAIARHRAPLIGRLARALPALGYRLVTPPGSPAPFVVVNIAGRDDIAARLRAADVNAAILGDVLRVSVSVFNTDDHVDRLIAALS